MRNSLKAILVTLTASVLLAAANAAMSKDSFLKKRAALIEKYSKDDPTFSALQNEIETEENNSSEYWHWRIDQYLYGQYTEFQPIYDAFTEGKSFQDIYDLPPETLEAPQKASPKLLKLPKGHFSKNLPGNTNTGSTIVANGKVYITYEGQLTDPYIASYDLKTGEWDGPYKAGHSTLSKGGRKVDSHGRPALAQDDDGFFHIVFGGHGGEREDGLNPLSIDTPHAGGRLTHVVSKKPNDISSFVVQDDVSPFSSYGSNFKMGNGDIYFFTRSGTHKSPWVFYRMPSGSQTFEAPVLITWPTPQKEDPITVDTFYISPKKVSDTDLIITYLWHVCNFREVHDRRHYHRINTYYMRMDTSDDTFYNVENQKLTLPLDKIKSDKLTLAYDSTVIEETCFGTKPLVLEDGRPAAAYEAKGTDYREWRMVAYEDGKWTHGLPMPGTESRSLVDAEGKKIKRIVALAKIEAGPQASTATVVYKDSNGETVFATATSSPELGTQGQDWKVDTKYAALPGARMQMQAVRNDTGEAVAVVLNIRKGASQRLYLWHDGELRPKN